MLIKLLAVPVICLQYVVNKDFIVANLCENRDKPTMHCNGKCLLNKQLAKAHESHDAQNQKGATVNISIDYFQTTEEFTLQQPSVVSNNYPAISTTGYTAGYPVNVFHPPLV